MKPKLSLVIPTKNSYKELRNFLDSCLESEYKDFEVIINDDIGSTDHIRELAESYKPKLSVTYLQQNIKMAQGRVAGAKYAHGKVIIHLDSDMQLTPLLLSECIQKIEKQKYDALIIPEQSFGSTFWARCKWLEKKCYEGVEQIESARCFRTTFYKEIGGHNIDMVFSEDRDLSIRAHQTSDKIGRTVNYLMHNEGDLKLLSSLKKKFRYAETSNLFAEQHPVDYRWQTNIVNRYVIYFRNIRYARQHPVLYFGMIFMKTCEFAAGAYGLIYISLFKNDRQANA
jgi:glycosyltransferase involved in cell wall biosynthesis